MKILKTILFIILILVIIFIILGFIGPKTYDVNRTVSIDAPRGLVWNEAGTLGEMQDWGPWKEEDPTMETTIHGTDGTVGAYSRWEGASVGEQKITKIVEDELLETELKFIEPESRAGKANSYLKLADNASGGTNVTWGMKGDNSFMARAMSMIGLGMDAFVGPMYEKGLFNLSNIVAESKKEMDAGQAASSNSAIKVSEVQNESHTFVVKRAEVKMENIAGFYAEHLPAIMMAVGAAGHEPAGMPCGLYYFWDEANGKTDMCAAIPVSDPKIQIEGYETVTLPAGKSVHVAHYGDYDKTAPVHMAIDNYMKANGLEQVGPVMEEYANDPTTVKPEEVLTNVYYPVK